jgi:CAAX prenyl protease-like protein
MLGAAMVTGAFSAGFDWLYGARMVAAVGVLWACRAAYRGLDWRGSWQACAIGVATFAMWIALFPSTLSDTSVWPLALRSASTWTAGTWLAVRLIGYVLVVPVVEELAFRVYAMRHLTHADIDTAAADRFSLSAFVISSILFGALHGGLWIQGMLAGMTFAYAFYRRRRIGDAVLAHATTNGLIALYVFATGRWSVWS